MCIEKTSYYDKFTFLNTYDKILEYCILTFKRIPIVCSLNLDIYFDLNYTVYLYLYLQIQLEIFFYEVLPLMRMGNKNTKICEQQIWCKLTNVNSGTLWETTVCRESSSGSTYQREMSGCATWWNCCPGPVASILWLLHTHTRVVQLWHRCSSIFSIFREGAFCM